MLEESMPWDFSVSPLDSQPYFLVLNWLDEILLYGWWLFLFELCEPVLFLAKWLMWTYLLNLCELVLLLNLCCYSIFFYYLCWSLSPGRQGGGCIHPGGVLDGNRCLQEVSRLCGMREGQSGLFLGLKHCENMDGTIEITKIPKRLNF